MKSLIISILDEKLAESISAEDGESCEVIYSTLVKIDNSRGRDRLILDEKRLQKLKTFIPNITTIDELFDIIKNKKIYIEINTLGT